MEITATYPAGKIGNTIENLKAAAAGEHGEWAVDYPEMAKVADEEGFPEIAETYRRISTVEKMHEDRYNRFLQNILDGKVFVKDEEVTWQCRNCGYILTGKEAPEECPACQHARAYFEVKKENY